MVKVTLSGLVPATVPTEGWKVGYRIKGSGGAFITPSGSPFMSLPIEFTTTDPGGTLYEGFIKRDCGALDSDQFDWTTPCNCTDGTYTPNAIGSECQKVDTIPATVTNPGYCLAIATNGNYSFYGSRIYNVGFTNSDLLLPWGTTGGNIYQNLSLAGQWANPGAVATIGPMNRESVWIDSDCNGTRDGLASGARTTIAAMYNNTGGTKTIYVGVAADNRFDVVVNGVMVASITTSPLEAFRIWHIIPITVVNGQNYINVIGTGDGTTLDALAMVVYDNTNVQIAGATSDAQLNIVFRSGALRGTSYDVATCPADYSMDTSGGAGNYVCRKTLHKVCNSAS